MTYKPAFPPFKHQIIAAERLANRSRGNGILQKAISDDVFALLAEMGTGKTKMITDEWGARVEANDLSDLLIIAPAGSYRNWWEPETGEIARHMPKEFVERARIVPWRSGGGVQWKKSMHKLLVEQERPRALIMNIEALSTVDLARRAVRYFLDHSKRGAMFVIDESTRARNVKAARTKALLGIAFPDGLDRPARPGATVRRILSGQPTPHGPMDLWAQFAFLDWRILGHLSFRTFMAHFAIVKKENIFVGFNYDAQGNQRAKKKGDRGGMRRIEHIVGYRYETELKGLIDPFSYRVLKEECLDLPAKTYQWRDVQLTDDQERIYREMKKRMTAELDDGTYMTAEAKISNILRLHQVLCGYATNEAGEIRDIKENRTEALLDCLEEVSGKVVIWATYRHIIERIAARLQEEYGSQSVAQFHGGITGNGRATEEARWKGDPACLFMLATQAAGGIGNNWQTANYAIYHANSWDLELRLQSEDRIHRAGTLYPCTYTDLAVRGTIDEIMIKNLRKKIDLSTLVLGDGYKKWLI